MEDQKLLFAQGTGAAIYFRLGWCPSRVDIQGSAHEDASVWTIDLAAGYGVESIDTTGVTALTTATGITLVKFIDTSDDLPLVAPEDVEPGRYYEANGIKIGASAAANVSGNPFTVQCYRMNVPIVRAVHDGGNTCHTYFQDSSMDFVEAGISGNGKFLLINETNNNMAYVGAITKPAGQANYCRIAIYEDAGLETATTAADFDDDDVIFIIPRADVQYPLLTLMT